LVIAAAGCAPGEAVDPQRTATSAVITNRNLDVLFMIDDSSSMRLSQSNLLNNFSTFTDALKNLPGGLPNIHLAVISSDTGAGDGSIAGCNASGGKQGIFQYTPRGTCTTSTLTAGATYISNVGGVANYTAPDISTVFTCLAALGEGGCGFEHQFDSVLRALGADGQPAPAENQGFLRRDALLAIIMLTNEDDCSARPDITLYEATINRNLSSALGPPSNFRCNEFGHVCNGAPPPREAPNGEVTDTVNLQSCVSSECAGSLMPVAEFVARIKALKAAPASEIVVAAIAGPPTPYQVQWKNPSISDSGPWPVISHSCTAADTSFADPGVRIHEWVSAFGANGFTSSICETSFAPAMQQVASRIGTLLTAGGGTGVPPGPIPNCATTGFGGGGGSAAGGSGTGGGGTGAGGAAGAGNTQGGDAGAGMTGRSNGGGCQTGGGAVNGWWLSGLIMVVLARRGGRRRARSSRR
jgi:hypothetical protein